MEKFWKSFKNDQPWILSWWGDVFGLHFMPFLGLLFLLIKPSFFFNRNIFFGLPLTIILFIDWGHIFAQWFRIYGNPAETQLAKKFYLFLYFAFIGLIYIYLVYFPIMYLVSFLVYFVLFHFMKQQIGYIKIAARGKKRNKKWKDLVEDVFFYGGIITPILYWHFNSPKALSFFPWFKSLITIPLDQSVMILPIGIYFTSMICYVFWEIQSYKAGEGFNFPKNLAILSSHLGWGIVSLFPDYFFLIYFAIIWAHDVSYIFFGWSIGNRDQRLQAPKVKKRFHWSSPLGAIGYFIAIMVLGDVVLTIAKLFQNYPKVSYYPEDILYLPKEIGHKFSEFLTSQLNFLKEIQIKERSVKTFGFSVFFGTQAHHYLIDRYLWRKEKDYAHQLRIKK